MSGSNIAEGESIFSTFLTHIVTEKLYQRNMHFKCRSENFLKKLKLRSFFAVLPSKNLVDGLLVKPEEVVHPKVVPVTVLVLLLTGAAEKVDRQKYF